MTPTGTRWPLLLGRRAFRLLATGPAALLFFAAVSLTITLAGPDLPGGSVLWVIGLVGSVLTLALSLSPFALVFFIAAIVRAIRRAVAMRACDLHLDAEGLQVVGGPAHGYKARWVELRHDGAVGMTAEGLRVHRADGMTLTVPAHGDAEERASLEALAATLGAHAAAVGAAGSTGTAASAPRRGPPGTLTCTGCGASLAPADRPTTHCGYCGAEHRVPEEIAAKVRATREVAEARRRDERLIASLARQPGARAANVAVFAGGLLMLPLTAVTMVSSGGMALLIGQETGMPRLAGLGLICCGLALGVLALVRRALADRRAVRALTLGFAPVEPARPGEPPACRVCFGPLPEPASGAWLVRCIYCGANHVSVADLRIEASIVQRFAHGDRDPDAALAPCRAARRRARIGGAVALALIAGGAGWLAAQPPPVQRAPGAVRLPFAPEHRLTFGAPTAGPGAVRVERVADLGDAQAVLLPNAGGGVDAIIVEEAGARRVRDPRGVVGPEEGERWPVGHRYAATREGGALIAGAGGVIERSPDGATRKRYGQGWLDDELSLDVAALPDGGFLVVTRASRKGHFRLRRAGKDGGAERILEDARYPAVAPDGRRLAMSVLVDDHMQLAAGEVDDPESLRVITQGEVEAILPAWSPDGSRVAFLSGRVNDPVRFTVREGEGNLWAARPDGTGAVRLTTGADLREVAPVWTGQGIFVLGRSVGLKGARTEVWRVDPR